MHVPRKKVVMLTTVCSQYSAGKCITNSVFFFCFVFLIKDKTKAYIS